MPRKYHLKPKSAPDDHPTFFAGVEDKDLLEGWELLLSPEEQQRCNYTAARIKKDQVKRDGIKRALGMNITVTEVCAMFHVHHRIVARIAEEEKIDLDGLKNSTGNIMLKASQVCARVVLSRALRDDIGTKDAAIAAGIFAQNGSLLTGSPTAILETRDRSGLTVEAVNGFWERIKRIKGATSAAGELAAPAAAPGAEAQTAPSEAPIDIASTVLPPKTP